MSYLFLEYSQLFVHCQYLHATLILYRALAGHDICIEATIMLYVFHFSISTFHLDFQFSLNKKMQCKV